MGLIISKAKDALDAAGMEYREVDLNGSGRLLVPLKGAHLLGPFDNTGNAVFWHPEEFASRVLTGEWNIGGERLWFAPEVQFHVRDRHDFWGTYEIPPSVDPALHEVFESSASGIVLAREAKIPCYNNHSGTVSVTIRRKIEAVSSPLHSSQRLCCMSEELQYFGYSHEVELRRSDISDAPIEPWTIIQLPPGGKIIVPATQDLEYEDFYEAIDPGYLFHDGHHLVLRIDGKRRYKVGLRSPMHFGRIGYLREVNGDAVAVVRCFNNDPSAPYVEEPSAAPGTRGLSISIYNDGGVFGGFGEMECNGRTVMGSSRSSTAIDRFLCWVFVGKESIVKTVVRALLGYEETPSYSR